MIGDRPRTATRNPAAPADARHTWRSLDWSAGVNRTAEDWWDAVRAAGDLPFGPARTAALERLVAETVDAPGYVTADVLDAVGHGGAHRAHHVVRPRRRPPGRADAVHLAAHPLRRRAAVARRARAARHPLDVPLDDRRHDRAPRGLAGADRGDARRDVAALRPRRRGHGTRAGLPVRGRRPRSTGRRPRTPTYLAWIAAPRTALSACAACERSRQAAHLAAIGLYDDAVRAVRPVLDGELTCDDEPATRDRARCWSRCCGAATSGGRRPSTRAASGCCAASGPGPAHARHLLVCARTGRLPRGLDLLEQWLPRTAPRRRPGELRMAAAGARLLRALVEAGRAPSR